MPHDPNHPLTRASYAAMIRETMAQYHHARRAGFRPEFWPGEEDPYAASPRLAIEDINKNNHMFVYPTHLGYGSRGITPKDIAENPLLADSGERWNGRPVTVNDVFRATHDYFGHAKEGVGFRHDGEENAWRSHAAMYSPLARIAMTNETRGQNSWVNFGPHGDHNQTAKGDTVFADQKIGHLPAWAQHEGAEDFTSPQEIAAIEAAYRATRHYPMSEGRHVVEHGGARLHYDVAPGGGVHVTDLHTEPDQRGQGRAASLMDGFTSALDREQRPATLVPFDPTGKGSLSDDQLQGFYKRRGFFPVRHQGAAAMFRNPRRARALGGPMGEEPQPMPAAAPGPVAPAAAPAGPAPAPTPEMNPAVANAMQAARAAPAAPPPMLRRRRRVQPIEPSEEEWGTSVPLRMRAQTLEEHGLDPTKTHNVRQVASAIEARQRKLHGTIGRDDRSEESAHKIGRWMATEIQHELKTPKKSGVGWYSTKYKRALDIFGQIHPELAKGAKEGLTLPDGRKVTPKEARHLLTSMIAVTSDGQKVLPNFRQAMDLYSNFRDTGKFTTERGHIRQDSVDQNVAKIQQMFDDMGATKMRRYLMQEATVENLRKIAREKNIPFSSDYEGHVTLPMSAITFGPKLGAFYANLMGAEGYLTMDRWWSRTFNRYRGNLLQAATPQGLERFKQLHHQAQRLNQPPEMMSDDEALAATKPYRDRYAAKDYKNGTEIEKAANTIYKAAFENLEDRPFNAGDRSFMLNAAAKAQEHLAKQGVKMSIADIQATLWYYEKRLYGDVGARQSADISYEDAAQQVASEIAKARAAGNAEPGGQPPPALQQPAVQQGAGGNRRPGRAPSPGGRRGRLDGGEVADDAPNPVNTETQSRVGQVRFDQRDGAGSVPNNANVNYLGFTAMMKPSRFLTLSHELKQPRPGHIEGLRDHIAAGNAIGSPFLRIDTADGEDDPEGTFGKVRQHDGRHRMRAIQALQGDTPVPVHVFGSHGDRARHLTPEMIDRLRGRLFTQGAGKIPMLDNFGDAFHLGKVLPGRPRRAGGGGFPKGHLFHSNLHHRLHVGPIHSAVHGRTDHLPMHVPSGSFVLPADVVSAHGEGNTMAGFKVMHRLFGGTPYGGSGGPYGQGDGPYGEALQNKASGGRVNGAAIFRNPSRSRLEALTERSPERYLRGMRHGDDHYWWDGSKAIHKEGADAIGIPYDYKNRLSASERPSGGLQLGWDDLGPGLPPSLEGAPEESRGGRAEGDDRGVPIVAAGGEYVLSPAQVRAVGNGDGELGARVLDEFVKRSRARNIKTLQRLPGPAKD